MDIRINDRTFSKEMLLQLIVDNKLQAIVHIRSIANIGLKDAKDIVENLDKNPDYYDYMVIKAAEKDVFAGESITLDVTNNTDKNTHKNRPEKASPFIIRNENSNKKWMYGLGIILLLSIIYFLITNN